MRIFVTIAAATLLAGCGLSPAQGGPELVVSGPSEAVAAFVRQQGAHKPSRATTFPQSVGPGRSSARVMTPAGTGADTLRQIAQQATMAGLTAAVVAAN
ncbi:hypothetical protein [Sphingomonas sp. SAFR-052]|uniref:hypothetical protein n=1 Tax=Sphingomonas sp. SAFR-052 TaxID=3436867 RepID=UPI003F7CE071